MPPIMAANPTALIKAKLSLKKRIEIRIVYKNMEPETTGCATERFNFERHQV